jgi:hypothetical protein
MRISGYPAARISENISGHPGYPDIDFAGYTEKT